MISDDFESDISNADQTRPAPARISIRRLLVADLVAYKGLRDNMLAAHPQAFSTDAAEARSRTADSYVSRLGLDRQEGGEFTLGAWSDSGLVGSIGCEREPRIKVRHVAHIVGMMVLDAMQGQGVGRALLLECISEARRADGLETLTLTVTAGNDAAIGLYERVGFVRYGSLPRAIRVDGRYYAKDQMMLDLSKR